MSSGEATNPHVSALLKKARRVLAAAERNLAEGDLETAINRAYYAAFHAASAAVLSEGKAPRSHKGTHDRFRVLFIETSRMPSVFMGTLSRAYQLRQKADYRYDADFRQETAEELLEEMRRFVAQVERVIT